MKTNLPIIRRPYWKIIRFYGGISLDIFITWRCNFKCSYCPVNVKSANIGSDGELSTEEWFKFITTFPVKVKEIIISGGEPTLKHGIVELINKLLKNGYFVCLYTNLSRPDLINEIKPSFKFSIKSNYHKGFISEKIFLNNLKNINHQILAGEFCDISNISPFLPKRKLKTDEEEYNVISKNCFRITPYGEIKRTCLEVARTSFEK